MDSVSFLSTTYSIRRKLTHLVLNTVLELKKHTSSQKNSPKPRLPSFCLLLDLSPNLGTHDELYPVLLSLVTLIRQFSIEQVSNSLSV